MSGRYHLKGLFTIVYTSFEAAWAMDEYCATARNAGISVAHLLPVTIAAAEFDFRQILDLTDVAVLKRLSTTRDELVHNDWQRSSSETVSQLIGRLASDNGFEAIVAPSMQGRKNLNLLRDNFLPTSKFQIINSADLPSNP